MLICNSFRKHNICGIFVLTWKWTVGFSKWSEDIVYKSKEIPKENGLEENCYKTPSIQSNSKSIKTVFNLQKYWSKCFDDSSVPDPDLSTKYIISHVLKIKKAYEYDLNMEREVSEAEENEIRKLCECRLARMPIQYIIKEWDFRDLQLVMTPPIFIPRPETEQLVDLVVERASSDSLVLEVGCGSGAICLSLLKALPEARVIAIDQSKLACKLTEKNAELNKLSTNLQVVHSKLQEDGCLSQPLNLDCPVDIIVSNPPYVPYAQLLNLQPEIKLYEDLRALEAGRDGLKVVRSLLALASTSLRAGGFMFLEVDSTHPPLIQKYVTAHPELNIKFVKSYKDFCDKDRFVVLERL